jgi:hypothetical protein
MRGLDPRIHLLKTMDWRVTPLRGGPAMTLKARRSNMPYSFWIPA